MSAPLIALGVGILVAACSSGREERPRQETAPDHTADAGARGQDASVLPQARTGDGVHTVKDGDVITAGNGISFRFGLKPAPFYGMNVLADAFIQGDPLNDWPRSLNKHTTSCNSFFLTDVQAVSSPWWSGTDYEVDVLVQPLSNGPISSEKDLYLECLKLGKTHGICTSFIPNEPGLGEDVLVDGMFKVFYPHGEAETGAYYLRQLKSCHAMWTAKHDIGHGTKSVPLRVLSTEIFPGKNTGGFRTGGQTYIRPDVVTATVPLMKGGDPELCSDRYVLHELTHLLRGPMAYLVPNGIEEGEAESSRDDLHFLDLQYPFETKTMTAGQTHTIPAAGGGSWVVTVGKIQEGSVTLTLGQDAQYTLAGGEILLFKDNVLAITADDVGPDIAQLRFYSSMGSGAVPIYERTLCGEDSFTTRHEARINGIAYALVDKDTTPVAYVSLDDATPTTSALYSSGYCFVKKFGERCGLAAMDNFLKAGLSAHETHSGGGLFQFCWKEAMSESCGGSSLKKLFFQFGLSGTTSCQDLVHKPKMGDENTCY